MTRSEIISFIKEFNKEESFSSDFVVETLRSLPRSDHELFLLLVNYKNGKDFEEKLRSGDI